MHRTTLVLDEKQLAKVKKILGTKGIKDTIDAAFAEIVAMEQRKRLVDRLASMNGLDLDDPKVMARAWR
jgi:Arc/MetJ family transcription regulator